MELINHAVTSLRAIRVGGTFSEQADRLESINADLGDVVFALSQELGDEGSVEDLDQINGRIHELGDLARRGAAPWPTCSLGGQGGVRSSEDLDAVRCPRELLICWKPTLPGSALPQMKAAAKAALAAPITRASAALSMKNYYQKLVRKGLVYPCFCSRSQLHARRCPPPLRLGMWYTPGPAGT